MVPASYESCASGVADDKVCRILYHKNHRDN